MNTAENSTGTSPVPPHGARALVHVYRLGRRYSLGRNKQYTYVYRRGLKGGEYSYATAVGMFQSVTGFALVIFANWLSRRYSETSLW